MRQSAVTTGTTGLLLGLVGCAIHSPPPGGQATAADAVQCIALNQVAGRRVVDGTSVLFEMSGPVDYRNALGGNCPGLARLGSTATISIASGGEGGRLCRGDRVRVVDPVETGRAGAVVAPTCVLDSFTPVARIASD